MRGNGACDEACNTAACGFDDGDCGSGGGSGSGDGDGDGGSPSGTDPWMVVAVTVFSLIGASLLCVTAVRFGQRCIRSRRAPVVGGPLDEDGSETRPRLPIRVPTRGLGHAGERAARSGLLEDNEAENARL